MGERYWIHDSVVEDQPGVSMPFGADTVGIVDENEGGVIMYVHSSNAFSVLTAMQNGEG